MSYSGEAAEQIVRMSLNGVEIAAKISGKAAERLAALLYAVLKDQKRTKGKIRLTNMLKSGKQLNVFAVKDTDLERFSRAAKQYGVLYCVLKDRKANDGLTDIMVRADDAAKINRIYERFNLAAIDMASLRTEVTKDKDRKKQESMPEPERYMDAEERVDEFMEKVIPDENPSMEKSENENPTAARKAKSAQSGHSSVDRKKELTSDEERAMGIRPSVRKEMEEIRRSQRMPEQKPKERTRQKPVQQHKAPSKKKQKSRSYKR